MACVIDDFSRRTNLHAAYCAKLKDDGEKISPQILVQFQRMHLLFRFVVTEASVAGALYFCPSTLSSL
jgi:hypothetical protein